MIRPQSARRQMVKAAMEAPFLTREEEMELAQRWKLQRDEVALHRLTSAHMRLVIALAARFKHFGLPPGDLIQEGHVGLLEAAARFEPDRLVRFSTYATWWIRASIQDFVLRNWSIVRGGTSSGQKALFFNLRRLRAQLNRGGQPMPDEALFSQIAEAIGVSVGDVRAMNQRLSGADASLNAPVMEDESGAERQDFLIANEPLQDEIVGEAIDGDRRQTWLKKALKVLSERELQILSVRRLSEEGATLESIGERLGISKERVRQIETRALEKLKSALLAEQPDRTAFGFGGR
ncbi:MAG: RNA polymerase factor sigma-32 [Ancalomicrobiaceae bacterium]|nr:RNA polymerase factor sigma-32 [Ancalomicrobiaceae bacterium]